MAKNAIVKKTPEMMAKAVARMATIDTEIETHLSGINKGYLSIAPLVAEVYDNEYYIALGYRNIDDYAKAEHEMSHGTLVGLRKVFARFGSSKENEDGTKSYTIPDKYTDWGYTKLLLIANDEKSFKDAGIEPFEVFKPTMTIKEMKAELQLKLAEKAEKQDANAIDTDGEIVNNDNNASADNASADNATAETPVAETEAHEVTFSDYLDELNAAIERMREYLKNDINEVKTCADTIKGNIKTLEKTYAKAHATVTVKDNSKKK